MRGTAPVGQLGDRKVVFLVVVVLFQVVDKGDHGHKLLVLLHDHHLLISLLRRLVFLETAGSSSFVIATVVLTGDLVKLVLASSRHQPEHIDPFVVPASLLFPVGGRAALDSILERAVLRVGNDVWLRDGTIVLILPRTADQLRL